MAHTICTSAVEPEQEPGVGTQIKNQVPVPEISLRFRAGAGSELWSFER